MRTHILKSVAIAAVVIVGATSGAAADPEKAAKARRGYFQLLTFNVGALAAMAKGEADYDAAVATQAAAHLDALTAFDVAPMHPEGSDNEALSGKTRAQPNIWSDFDGYVGKYQDLAAAVDALNAQAGNGVDGVRQTIGKVGAACKSCHDEYRAKEF